MSSVLYVCLSVSSVILLHVLEQGATATTTRPTVVLFFFLGTAGLFQGPPLLLYYVLVYGGDLLGQFH